MNEIFMSFIYKILFPYYVCEKVKGEKNSGTCRKNDQNKRYRKNQAKKENNSSGQQMKTAEV